MIKTISITVLCFLFITYPIYAAEPPILISPANNSTISSIPTFSWQAVSGSTGYNILIDDEPTVTSPYAKTPYYPTNPSYSPQTLNPGTYYWKVKAKDSGGNWGSFSSIWSFILSSSSSSPTPTPAPTPNSTNSPTNSPSTSSFTISNIPSQINSDQLFNVAVNLSLPGNPNTIFYLKGAFKKADSSNYFGLIKVSGSWIKNGSSYSSQYQITTDSSGNWSGSLEVEPDSEDSGFTGTDNYIFKVGRYTSSGSGPTWSNEETIKISGSQTSQSSTTTSSNTAKSITHTTSPSSQNRQILSASKTSNIPVSKTNIASVAGEATSAATSSASPSTTAEIKENKLKFLPWVGVGFILAGISSLIFIYLRAKKNV